MNIIGKFPILLPKKDLEKWAVVACDQYTTQPSYWEKLEEFIGEAPSTLKITFPEIFLKENTIEKRIKNISDEMQKYIDEGVFFQKNGMVLTERFLSDGTIRVGLVLSVDLETYEYKRTDTYIRATEKTIEERLPVRIKIRSNASIELPHTLLLLDDDKKQIIEPIYQNKNSLEKIYDFGLNMGGGHICGYFVPFSDALIQKFYSLLDSDEQIRKYGVNSGLLFAVGDGNHSMATAKEHWNKLKQTLPIEQQSSHPARYMLVEVVNLYQDSMNFHPIHRVIKNVNTEHFISELGKIMCGDAQLELHTKEGTVYLPCSTDNATVINEVQTFLLEYAEQHHAVIEYEHSGEQTISLAKNDNTVGIILPTFDKSKLFNYVIHNGHLPQKAFSIGTEDDKKYYIEAKRITL